MTDNRNNRPKQTPTEPGEVFQTNVETPAGTFSVGFQPSDPAATPVSASAAPAADAPPAQVNASVPTAMTGGGGGGRVLRDDTSGTDGSFFNQLTGIPIEYLVATPLIASARANMALAQVMSEFIDEIGFTGQGESSKTRLVEFQLTREIQDPVKKTFSPQTINVQAPLLALVPIPALLIQSVTVDLTVEISQAVAQNNTSTTNASLQVGANWGWGNASFTGSYSNSQTNTRSTNQSAKYEVTINAQQQPVPEGMSRLMDVFASTITPIPASST